MKCRFTDRQPPCPAAALAGATPRGAATLDRTWARIPRGEGRLLSPARPCRDYVSMVAGTSSRMPWGSARKPISGTCLGIRERETAPKSLGERQLVDVGLGHLPDGLGAIPVRDGAHGRARDRADARLGNPARTDQQDVAQVDREAHPDRERTRDETRGDACDGPQRLGA